MATKLFLKAQLNPWNGIYGHANIVRSVAAAVTSVTNTTASGTKIQATKTGGGTAVKWISPPVSAVVTISGTITNNLWAKEQAIGNNATVRIEVAKWSVASQSEGAAFSATSLSTELTTTNVANNWTDASPTSTTFQVGDRIVMYIYIVNVGTMGAGSPGVTVTYSGPTNAASGDSYVQFNEAITFLAEPEVEQLQVNGSSLSTTFTGTNVAGNLIVAFATWGDTLNRSITSVTDTKGNVYTAPLSKIRDPGNTIAQQIWIAKNIGAQAANQVTFNFDTPPAGFETVVSEHAGLDTVNPYVTGSQNSASTGTALTCGAATAVDSNTYIYVGMQTASNVGFTAGTNYVLRDNGFSGQEDIVVTVPGSYNSSATLGSNDKWTAQSAFLRSATQPPFEDDSLPVTKIWPDDPVIGVW